MKFLLIHHQGNDISGDFLTFRMNVLKTRKRADLLNFIPNHYSFSFLFLGEEAHRKGSAETRCMKENTLNFIKANFKT